MRAYQVDLLVSGLWALMAWGWISSDGWDPFFLGIATLIGIILGAAGAMPVLRGINKKGEYHPSKAFPLVGLILGAIFLWGLFAGRIPTIPSSSMASLFLSLPIASATSAGLFLSWEKRRGAEVHSRVLSSFYYVKANHAQGPAPEP